jgi:hypothetical protein
LDAFHGLQEALPSLLTGQAAASSPETREKKAEADVPLEPSDENEPAVLPLSPVDQTREDDEGGWQQVRKIKGKKTTKVHLDDLIWWLKMRCAHATHVASLLSQLACGLMLGW